MGGFLVVVVVVAVSFPILSSSTLGTVFQAFEQYISTQSSV